MRKRSSPIWFIPKEKLELIVNESSCIADVLRKLGFSVYGGNNKTLKARLEYDNIDYSHIKSYKNPGHKQEKVPNLSLFSENSPHSRNTVKRRIIDENIIDYKCSLCGNDGNWMGKPLSLVLDHINGKNNDNRLENLRFLCSNCNSQTDTFASKNKKGTKIIYYCKSCGVKITNFKNKGLCFKCSSIPRRITKRPPFELLMKTISENGYRRTGKIYGVADNTIRRWVHYYKKYGDVV